MLRDISEIHRIISRDDLDYIFLKSDKNISASYCNDICTIINYLYEIKGLSKVVSKFLEDFKKGYVGLNRSLVHLFLAYKLNHYNLLSSIEESKPAFDFVLMNGIKIELTRYGDYENLITRKIEEILKNNLNLKNRHIILRLKTNNISVIDKKLLDDISRFNSTLKTDNDVYELEILERSGNDFNVPIDLRQGGILLMSNRVDNNICIQFLNNKIDLNAIIFDKNKKEACSLSDILIIDLTSLLKLKNYRIDRNTDLDIILEDIDVNSVPKNIKAVVIVYFYYENQIIKSISSYKIFKLTKEIKDFENNFLLNIMKKPL